MHLTFISSGLCKGLFQTSLCGENAAQIDDALGAIGGLSSAYSYATSNFRGIQYINIFQRRMPVKGDLSRK
jgi:hypothetical protein